MTAVREQAPATERSSGSVPVIDGVLDETDGLFFHPVHRKMHDIWRHLEQTRQIRLRLVTTDDYTGLHGEGRRTVNVAYTSAKEEREIWKVKKIITDGVREWLHDGNTYPRTPSTPNFFNRYVKPRLGDTISSLAPRRRRPRSSRPSQ